MISNNKYEAPSVKQLSDTVRERIRLQETSRRIGYRKESVCAIMVQNRCGVVRAIEIYKNRCVAKLGYVPDDVLADLESVREELAENGTATA